MGTWPARSNLWTPQLALSTAVRNKVTKTVSEKQLLRNSSAANPSSYESPAPPPCSWFLLGSCWCGRYLTHNQELTSQAACSFFFYIFLLFTVVWETSVDRGIHHSVLCLGWTRVTVPLCIWLMCQKLPDRWGWGGWGVPRPPLTAFCSGFEGWWVSVESACGGSLFQERKKKTGMKMDVCSIQWYLLASDI